MEHKKYGLLENGDIEPLYYGDYVEPRLIVEEDNEFYLLHDVYKTTDKGLMICFCKHKIIKESDSYEELEVIKNEANS